jgi:hypothetical protein
MCVWETTSLILSSQVSILDKSAKCRTLTKFIDQVTLFIVFFIHFFDLVSDLLNHFQHASWIVCDSKDQTFQNIDKNQILLLWIVCDEQNIKHEVRTFCAHIQIDNVLSDELRCSDSKWLHLTRHDECRIFRFSRIKICLRSSTTTTFSNSEFDSMSDFVSHSE